MSKIPDSVWEVVESRVVRSDYPVATMIVRCGDPCFGGAWWYERITNVDIHRRLVQRARHVAELTGQSDDLIARIHRLEAEIAQLRKESK